MRTERLPGGLAPLTCVLAIALAFAAAFARVQPAPALSGHVDLRAVPQRTVIRPGDQAAIAVVLEHQPGWHSWPQAGVPLPPDVDEFAQRTAITVPAPPSWVASVDGVQYPPTHPALVANPSGGPPIEVPTYSDRAVAFVRILVSPQAPDGEHAIDIAVAFQSCNDVSCDMPKDVTLTVPVRIARDGTSEPVEPDLFASLDLALWGTSAADDTRTTPAPVRFDAFGLSFSIDPRGPVGIGLLMLVAALGGFLLNCTPCVLPVIPLKILGLSQAAGNPARCLLLGAVMSAGVVAFWIGIGTAMALVTGFKSISALYQNSWFPFLIGLFMAVMGLGMFNLFTVKLPGWIYALDPKRESVQGSFAFGVLTAILSTPCTAPFMGAAAGWAAFQPPALTITTFAMIGVGMALPYLVLAANPSWVSRVPRTGAWSEVVKQLLGLLMLAVAAFFIGLPVAGWLHTPPDPVSRAYWWIVGGLVACAGLWLAWSAVRLHAPATLRAALVPAGAVIAGGALWLASGLASHGPIRWVHYTPERFDEAVAARRVVVMDFTAEWCLNCKALEAGVLHRPEIVRLLNGDAAVTPMKVDITGDNPAGKAKLNELDWVGIPLLAVFGPGLDEPIKMDAYTPQMVLEAIERARGGSGAALGRADAGR